MPQTSNSISPVSDKAMPPRLMNLCDAVAYSATSRAKLYLENKAGRLNFIKLDGATRIEVAELDRWINAKAESSKAA